MAEFIFSWDTLWWVMLLFYIPSCIGLIAIVLLQKGKGVGFAGAFGIGPGSDTVFGPRMSRSLPAKLTYVMAALFLILAMAMSLISHRVGTAAAPDKVDENQLTEQQIQQEALIGDLKDRGIGSAPDKESDDAHLESEAEEDTESPADAEPEPTDADS
jgi:preprotein translocase subunit SecG